MPSRTYTIKVQVQDNTPAAINRVAQHFQSMETKALGGARKIEDSINKITKSAELSAEKRAAIEDRYIKKDYDSRVRAEAKKEQLAASTAEKKAAKVQAIEDKYLQADYKNRVAFEKRKEQEASAAQARMGRENEKHIDRLLAGIRRHDAQWKKSLTDEEIQRKVHNAKITQENDKRVEAAMRAAGLEVRGLNQITDAVGQTIAGYMSFQGVINILQGVGSAIDEAQRKQQQWAAGFRDQRDQLRELAAIEGVQADNAFVQRFNEFNVKTGMMPSESVSFQTEMQNSGAQFKGKTITAQEYDQFKEQAAQLAVARGVDPRIAGDLAGNILGFHDYKQHGEQASEEALGRTNTALAILGRGKGRNAVLVDQMSRIMSSSLNEDEMKGTFQSEEEVAIATSLMAELKDEEASTYVKASIRGLRDFEIKKDKHGREQEGTGLFLKKAGITPKDSFFEAIGKLGPAVEKEAKARGLKVEDVLREKFEDERTRKGLAVAINKGLGPNGAIADRQKFAAQIRGPKSAMALIDQFQGSEVGQSRVADAQVKAAEGARGQETSKLDILRRQAYAELVQEKSIGTPSEELKEFVINKASFGLIPNVEQSKINVRVARILERRAKAAGLPTDPWSGVKGTGFNRHTSYGTVPFMSEDTGLNAGIKLIEDNKGNAMSDKVKAEANAGGGPQASVDMRETNGLLREQLRAMRGGPLPVGFNLGRPGMARA